MFRKSNSEILQATGSVGKFCCGTCWS